MALEMMGFCELGLEFVNRGGCLWMLDWLAGWVGCVGLDEGEGEYKVCFGGGYKVGDERGREEERRSRDLFLREYNMGFFHGCLLFSL